MTKKEYNKYTQLTATAQSLLKWSSFFRICSIVFACVVPTAGFIVGLATDCFVEVFFPCLAGGLLALIPGLMYGLVFYALAEITQNSFISANYSLYQLNQLLETETSDNSPAQNNGATIDNKDLQILPNAVPFTNGNIRKIEQEKVGRCELCGRNEQTVCRYEINDHMGKRYRYMCQKCVEEYSK